MLNAPAMDVRSHKELPVATYCDGDFELTSIEFCSLEGDPDISFGSKMVAGLAAYSLLSGLYR